MDREFWINRWNDNQIGFHVKGVNPLLTRYWSAVSSTATGRVLVPLCGKSEDLRWLAERGHDVVGVEFSLIAAKAFAAEQGMTFIESHEPPFTVLRGEKVTFYVGDFFNVTPGIVGTFGLLYDRAALIALPPEVRPAYVEHLSRLFSKAGKALLIGLEYDPSQMHGPPFAVAEAEVRRLFKDLRCEKLLQYDCLESEPRFKARGVTWMKEVVYLLEESR